MLTNFIIGVTYKKYDKILMNVTSKSQTTKGDWC